MSDLGNAIGYYIGGMIVMFLFIGIVIGLTLAYGVPILYHLIETHVTIH